MPIHDWTRVADGIFHSFHLAWIAELNKALNNGILPNGYYALSEQITGGVGPDVLTLQAPSEQTRDMGEKPGGLAVAQAPPRVRRVVQAHVDSYALKQKSVVIRHASNHGIVAILEILSPGNKSSRYAIQTFLEKCLAILTQGIHLVLIDLLPPSTRDPNGIHALVWEKLTGETDNLEPAGRTLASYDAGPIKTAYVEPISVGDALPDMPLFLEPGEYVNIPMEGTYREAFLGSPKLYRDQLEK